MLRSGILTTIKDVARVSGVSVTTVSRVLNNKGYISEETKQKVHQAMTELNYEPSEIARSLFRKKSNMIGLIVPNVAHPFFAELTSYIESYAQTKGYKILLCNSLLDIEKEKEYIKLLKSNQVDGIIMGSHSLEIDEYKDLNLPLVTLDRQIDVKVPYVCSDNYLGGVLATEALIDAGCKNIVHISGNLNLNNLSNQRCVAFEQTCQVNNVAYTIYESDMTALETNDYSKILHEIFTNQKDIDGIFASSDIIAAQIIKFCRKLGKEIPKDLKIVGYDDTEFASYLEPELTTIKQPIKTLATYSIDLIIKQIEGELTPNCTTLPVELMRRETC